MRIFLLYFAYLSVWVASSWCYNITMDAYMHAKSTGFDECQWLSYREDITRVPYEIGRNIIYTASAIFLFLSVLPDKRSYSLKVHKQHVFVVVSAKMVEHWIATTAVLGFEINVTAYTFNVFNYVLAVVSFAVAMARIFIYKHDLKLKQQKKDG